MHRLTYNSDVALGQLAVFKAAHFDRNEKVCYFGQDTKGPSAPRSPEYNLLLPRLQGSAALQAERTFVLRTKVALGDATFGLDR